MTDMHSKPFEQLVPKQVVIQATLTKNNWNIHVYLFFCHELQNKTGNRIGSCYSDDHIAKAPIHTDNITCRIEEQKKK